MGHSVTLGGDRVGSGNKNKIYLHNYERSTHNLSEKFTSSLGVGMLVPFLVIPATRDDKFEIDLSAGLRTIPTKGPLFGSFKLQLDIYQCPWRLYQALLHNNPLAIGLKANQVKFPKLRLFANVEEAAEKALDEDPNTNERYYELKAANNSLIRYLGIAGIGNAQIEDANENGLVYREVTGSHLLAYYDIFKNYYANKQEENAYTLKSKKVYAGQSLITIDQAFNETNDAEIVFASFVEVDGRRSLSFTTSSNDGYIVKAHYNKVIPTANIKDTDITFMYSENLTISGTIREFIENEYISNFEVDGNKISFILAAKYNNNSISKWWISPTDLTTEEVELKSFPLKNIDDMRMKILSHHQLGQSFVLYGSENSFPPYSDAYEGDRNKRNYAWQKNLAGLCVKTYQSDLFNNWINTEWVDGENGIAAITAISTSDGKITIDALNFSEKLYNLLNRIAVSGNTYEDYLDAAYTDSAKKFCEAPMWIGGMSDEIVFEEIVQTAPADGSALGTLGGRGNLLGKKKGGKITVKVDEPSWIIGIVSITPRIQYTQGLEWYNTEIDSLQDLHVPALDGIAFQNLMASQMHFASDEIGFGTIGNRPIVGKVPAWINYMTAVDKAFGDFAAEDGDGYMILNRNYEFNGAAGELIDATTYIDPAKYNYAFAYTKRDAQNFWVQIHSDIKARRLMSAKQIPNV